MSDGRDREIARLRRERPRHRLARVTVAIFAAVAALAWTSGVLRPGDLFLARRGDNLRRFLFEELPPPPLVGGVDWGTWLSSLLDGRGLTGALAATATTLSVAVLATALAAAVGAALAPLAARTLAVGDPYGRGAAPRGRAFALVARAIRTGAVLARSIPEYVLAFLLLAVFGFDVWPLVLALAIHNAAILTRLGAETLENLDATPLRQLRRTGADRGQLFGAAALPAATPTYLLYGFYRFETCAREATVLGMLGVSSLGYWIEDMRTRQFYDELLVLVLLGAGLVLAADAASTLARSWIRRSI